jgi:phage terminase Nu1 subunit (DNA packaging protein)
MSNMLSSWKEIAQFFGKGVRTVQRWEKTLDLPIHRPPGAPSNVVLARESDLEAWMHRGLHHTGQEAHDAEDVQHALETLLSAIRDAGKRQEQGAPSRSEALQKLEQQVDSLKSEIRSAMETNSKEGGSLAA